MRDTGQISQDGTGSEEPVDELVLYFRGNRRIV